jgi:hypothetical protein
MQFAFSELKIVIPMKNSEIIEECWNQGSETNKGN